ncbi:MAG: hypothetical protein Kow0099_15530 [Candidatus Abyssubacteria bacterium]
MEENVEQRLNQTPEFKKIQLVEVCIFLLLIFPVMVLSLFATRQTDLTFQFVAISTILQDLSLVALVFYFVWRNGETPVRLGWTSKGAVREFFLGIALFFPFALVVGGVDRVVSQLGFSVPGKTIPSFLMAKGVWEYVLAFVLIVVVAVAEETIFRGYLILRFRSIVSTEFAVVFSSVIFSLGHGYEGSGGVMVVAVIGVIFALVYLWRGSLIAPIVMHFIQNFAGLFILPLTGGG